jgi:hypothetical protein
VSKLRKNRFFAGESNGIVSLEIPANFAVLRLAQPGVNSRRSTNRRANSFCDNTREELKPFALLSDGRPIIAARAFASGYREVAGELHWPQPPMGHLR